LFFEDRRFMLLSTVWSMKISHRLGGRYCLHPRGGNSKFFETWVNL